MVRQPAVHQPADAHEEIEDEARRQTDRWLIEKENAGRFSWTLGLYGTPAMAAEAGMSSEEYWEQIIHACFLDEQDPIARWREVGRTLERNREQAGAVRAAGGQADTDPAAQFCHEITVLHDSIGRNRDPA